MLTKRLVIKEFFIDLGLTDYEKALSQQMTFLEQVQTTQEKGLFIFCSHPAIITLGRAAQESDITHWNGPRLEVSRGGKVTYHGPSQLVVYPIINLAHASSARPARDIHAYIRLLEQCVCEALKDFGLNALGKSGEHDTGIWVGDKKVASIGIAIRHWITYHGVAINVDKDPSAFQGINPCGISSSVMSSMEELLGQKISRHDLSKSLKKHLLKIIE